MRIESVEQGSHDWHLLRQGIVTGTSLGAALGSPKVQATLMYELIAEMMTEPQINDLGSEAVKRGNEMEPIARRAVSDKTKIKFVETGMLFSDDIDGFGFSPDGIAINKKGVIEGGLEIKCPNSKKHIEYIVKDEIPSEYLAQVKAPFLLSDDICWWYFASFDDRNYERPLFLKLVKRSDFPTIEEDREKLKDFINRTAMLHAELTF